MRQFGCGVLASIQWKLEIDPFGLVMPVQTYETDRTDGKWVTQPDVKCPDCGFEFVIVAPLGFCGAQCPSCGIIDGTVIWDGQGTSGEEGARV